MQSLSDKIFRIYLNFVVVWVTLALLFDITMITLHFVDDKLPRKVITHLEKKMTI